MIILIAFVDEHNLRSYSSFSSIHLYFIMSSSDEKVIFPCHRVLKYHMFQYSLTARKQILYRKTGKAL
jgi:hypothetical protein